MTRPPHLPPGGAAAPSSAPRLLDVEDAPPGTFGELEPSAPPLTDAQGRLRLSFSRIDRYRTCPRSFRYRYLDRLPEQPSPHLSFGSSVHAALEAYHDHPGHDEVPGGQPDVQVLLDALYAHWDRSGYADRPRDEQVRAYRQAQEVLRRYHDRGPLAGRRVVATEAWFEVPFAYEAVVVGSIDRVDLDENGDLHVVDYKTSRRARPRAEVAASLQLSLYALACRTLYGRLPATVALDFVVPGVTVAVETSELDLDGARQAVLDTAAQIRAERFPATPNRLCDWCDHRAVCPAWSTTGADVYAELVAEAAARRRRLTAEVRELRELEAGLKRLAGDLELDR
ncbi:MAG: RecB family exonuclease [Nitriliruptoraceae bacterium]